MANTNKKTYNKKTTTPKQVKVALKNETTPMDTTSEALVEDEVINSEIKLETEAVLTEDTNETLDVKVPNRESEENANRQAPNVNIPNEQPTVRFSPRDLDINQRVIVRNGYPGQLVYKSPRTGEVIKWGEFGDEQEMELRELRDAKNSHKKMFRENWFLFEDDWVVDYLGVGQYYKNALKINEFDKIFKLPTEELKSVISKLSDGQKLSISFRARALIDEGVIDSVKTVSMLEEVFGTELTNK